MLDKLKMIISEGNIFLLEPMSKHTTFKIGGPADYFVIVFSIDELIKVAELARKENVPFYVIGNGSNILVKDDGIRGIVGKLNLTKTTITSIDDDNYIVEVGAGMTNAAFAKFLAENELSGFEFASGIPGTIGGSVRMNAGAFGGEFKDIVREVTFLDIDSHELYTYQNDKLNFSYRHSMFIDNKNLIIVKVQFIFKKASKELIKNRIAEIFNERKEKQPIDKPSAGSTFRRINGFIPAKAIDEAGLKGYSIDGAEVSTKHAGFIINTGNATANDVLTLIDIIKQTIKEKYNVELNPEMEIWGE